MARSEDAIADPPVAAMITCAAHEPKAMTIVFQK